MDPDQSCNRKAGFQRVGDQSILEVERQALHTENLRRIAGLYVTRSSARVSGRSTVAEVNEQRGQPFLRQLRRGPTYRDFQVVRMCAEGEYVESLIHVRSLTSTWSSAGPLVCKSLFAAVTHGAYRLLASGVPG